MQPLFHACSQLQQTSHPSAHALFGGCRAARFQQQRGCDRRATGVRMRIPIGFSLLFASACAVSTCTLAAGVGLMAALWACLFSLFSMVVRIKRWKENPDYCCFGDSRVLDVANEATSLRSGENMMCSKGFSQARLFLATTQLKNESKHALCRFSSSQ
jgi:hypothetical protein